MAQVQLRDIVTKADRVAVLDLQRAPGQERFLGSMASHFEDAAAEPWGKPRMWSVHDGDQLVGFVMISDNIEEPGDDMLGPYYLWRVLVDARFQRRGYGAATLDAVVAYLRTRPGADVLWTSCGQGEGTPQPFYEEYGFVATGEIKWDEVVLRLDLKGKDTRSSDDRDA